ncbi:MAG: hypothetical protein SFV15_19320 [Polyangiaceae bacterium]|nr:hypothetical protein [Polyangiaceae bacterium]
MLTDTLITHIKTLRSLLVLAISSCLIATCRLHAAHNPERARKAPSEPITATVERPPATLAPDVRTPNASSVQVPELPAPAPAPPPAEHDPELLARLTIKTTKPKPLAKAKFRSAAGLFREVIRGVANRSLLEEKDEACQQTLVTDQNGTVRGFTWFGGTEHHYAEYRRFFDQNGVLRLLLHMRRDEQGGWTEDVVAFDQASNVSACEHIDHRQGMPRPDLCEDEEPEPKVDPEVQAALKPSPPHRRRNRMLEYLQSIDPKAQFRKCEGY